MKITTYAYKKPKIKTNIINILKANNHEKLIFGYDAKSGLKIVLAIHSTVLGPSTGGTRMVKVSESHAIDEALRLSYAMTYKNAIIDEPYGGSKAVIIGDPLKDKSEELLLALGDFIQSLKGIFLTGVDMGLSLDDAKTISKRTNYIFNSKGCSGVTTGHGVYKGIKQCAKEVYGSSDLRKRTIAIQGLGYVGGTLAKLLNQDGANLIIADTDPGVIKLYSSKYRVRAVPSNKISEQECDIFSPCAVGEIINDKTIRKLKCRIIAGGANNQLKDEIKHSYKLMDKGILHAPDFVINAGGVCHGMCEVRGENVDNAMKKTDLIPDLLSQVFKTSKKENIPPMIAAYALASKKIEYKKKKQ